MRFRVLFLFITLFFSVGLLANPYADSLLDELEANYKNTETRVDILNILAKEYAYDHPFDGMLYAKEAKWISEQLKYKNGLAVAYGNLGLLNHITGQFENALEYYQECSVLFRELNDKSGLVKAFDNLGAVYGSLKQFRSSYDSYKRGLELEEELNNQKGISDAYINLGDASKNLGENEEALDYYRKSMRIKTELNDSNGIIKVLSGVGVLYLEMDKLDSSRTYLEESLRYYIDKGDKVSVAKEYNNLCLLECQRENYGVAIGFGNKALALSREINHLPHLRNSLRYLSTAYRTINDYGNAFELQKGLMMLNDSIYSDEKKDIIANLEGYYQSEIKESEIANLKIQNTIKEIAIDKERKDKRMLIIILGLIFLVSLITFYFYLSNRKKNTKLRAQNRIIQVSHREIEELIKESHHRIKNNLQVVSSMLKLQARSVKSIAAKEALDDAQHRMKAIALIHQKLYQNDSFKTVNIREFLIQLVDDLNYSLIGDSKEIEIETDVDTIEMKLDTAIPLGLSINELITNALKYAFVGREAGKINISLKRIEHKLLLKVSDDGNGFPKNFNIEEDGNFGFRILKSLLRKYRGEISTYSHEGAHVQITINKF